MTLKLNGVEIDDLRVNGVKADKGYLNGREVYSRMGPGAVIDGDIVFGKIGGYWYLAAPATKRKPKKWAANDTFPNGVHYGTDPDPHSGEYNTTVLVNAANRYTAHSYPAAEYCRSLGSEYSLPNREELEILIANKGIIDAADVSGGANTILAIASGDGGASSNTKVWSSTNSTSNLAYFRDADSSWDSRIGKQQSLWVIPVRRIRI